MSTLLSASSFYRDSNCYVNRRLSREAEERGVAPPESTAFTRRGTRVHAGEGETRDERDAYEITSRMLNVEIQNVLGNPITLEKEKRLYLRDENFEPFFTGQPDRFVVTSFRGVVGDLKPGFETDWPAWQSQMACYAALVFDNYGISDSVTTIVQTRFYGHKTLIYSDLDCLDQLHRIRQVVKVYQSGDAEKTEANPGPWCRYCKARLSCAAALSITPATAQQVLYADLPAGEKGAELVEALKRFIKIAKDRLKWYEEKLEANPDFIPDWKLASRKDPSIVDARAAIEILGSLITYDRLYEAVSISVPKLRSILRDMNPDLSENDAKSAINTLLGDLIQYKESEKWLARK